jgi:hypothetical protein
MSSMLPGRIIDDVAFTGLVERLIMISLVSGVATEDSDRISKDDLLSMIDRIRSCSVQGLEFTGVTDDEVKATRRNLVAGTSRGRLQRPAVRERAPPATLAEPPRLNWARARN